MAKKKKKEPKAQPNKFSPTIKNKRAKFEYQILEKLECGMVLVGTEVKSLREGKASLEEAYARIHGGELVLMGCNINVYSHGNLMNHEPARNRKLLAHKREIKKLEDKLKQKRCTLIPLRIYFNRGKAKIEIALATGKSHADKRDKLKKDQMKRDTEREMRRFNR